MEENLATKLLQRAVDLEHNNRLTEALVCYQESLEIYINQLKLCNEEGAKKVAIRKCVSSYMDKAEKLKSLIEAKKEAGKYHEQIFIKDNSIGYSYESLFGRFIDETVTWVNIQDPYIRSDYQIFNFLRFCELVYKKSNHNIKTITLNTSRNEEMSSNHQNKLLKLKSNLESSNVELVITFSDKIHDREISLENGWIIKIGRGLDYFKSIAKFHIGYCDYDLRPCFETTVNIFNKKSVKNL